MTKVVAVSVRHCNEGLDRVNILSFDLRDGRICREEGETSQRLDESVPFERHVEDASDADGTTNTVEAQRGHVQIVTILEADTKRS